MKRSKEKRKDWLSLPRADRMENMRRLAKRRLGLHGKRKAKYRILKTKGRRKMIENTCNDCLYYDVLDGFCTKLSEHYEAERALLRP